MEITISGIQLFQIIKQKLGEKEAEALVAFVETTARHENENSMKTVVSKEELAVFEKDILSEIKVLRDDINKLKMELKLDIKDVRVEMKDQKAELIKWMFIFWVGAISIITGIMITLFHAYIK
jgi:hypothetical protein